MPNNVVSKYFSSEAVMDDSLCDFQEKKKYNTGPKNVKKTRNIKKPKRTRGQKDIRALIKKQENDVLSYSKNFDKVCKEAGVDIDSEELQLAIALSKSLDEVKKDNNSGTETKSTEHLTSQERTLKIKRTLQEYGFRIPKTKITETNKRKKFRKQYKLLLTTETERQQIISDKYSEVLAGNIFKSPVKVLECDYSDKELYYKTTNIAYEHIKNDDVYYVKDLFDKTTHRSCLLRDWSEIPGRPLSPTVEVNSINFDDIICNQCELDCILSGTIFSAQQIVTNKKNSDVTHNISITVDKTNQFPPKPLENEVGCTNYNVITLIKGNNTLKETDCYTNSETMSVSEARCISPDLFDDEVSAVIECPDNSVLLSVETVSKTDNIHTYCMDLTECVGIDSSNSDFNTKTKLQTNNEINTTNRKSNDLMEMTECVSTGSKQTNFENIDLTQSSNESCKQTTDNCSISLQKNIEVMDLTQVQDYDLLAVKIGNFKNDNCLDDTIIVVNDDLNLKLQQQKKNLNLKELPEPICIDDLNKGGNYSSSDIDKAQSHQSSSNSYKDHLYRKSCENSSDYKMYSLKNIEDVGECKNKLFECQPDEFDLTQSSNSSQGETLTNQPSSNYSTSLGKRDNVSIDYDEISDNIGSKSVTSLKLYECQRNQSNSIEKEVNKIASNPNKTLEGFEFSEKQSSYSVHQSKHKNIDFRCITITNDENVSPEKEASNSKYNEIATNTSNSLEVFEISDNEFKYSLHQSKHDNFDFRDVSVMNDFSNHESSYNIGTKTRSLSESNLQTRNISPCKEVSQSQKLNFSGETSKPMKMRKENIENVLQTPKNGEYIVKTNEVTPMLDYASMSSPERHKELEKYGLKPFKRKRAIQLLTHLYNQTHPIIESLNDDDCPSPSKRQKKDDGDEKCNSLKKLSEIGPLDSISRTSIVLIKSIESIPEGNKENDLYAITKEQPDIRNMECDPEDWFFQKREKAKLHSCRVPLHVAFHNYVSCRRRLREAILRYEPVNIDVIHKDLVATGYRYNPKDLFKFMDRKCITVKTADNNSRNRKS